MSQIQIICTSPGMRRQGIVHTASAIYEEGHWTETQLQAFKDDPSFIVQPVGAGGVQLSGDDFDSAVAAKVSEQLATLQDALQVTFDTAVAEKARERIEKIRIDHSVEVDALKADIAELTAKLASAEADKKAATKK
ncbi:hypothetical protein PDO_1888 [Rhizobium sp. PDO1-076]|uniref:hypothetical protein n=1 Tax=Rhizobium sp. PDO1-076 TaxID=1125979 RepID=UPI00024E35C1|nr:hypothetical protein [Rhizobium sp. PDO1-076]EHS51497.1 hypothetical protein PDO_1888 [Rhizobium sp. PDO1-076]